MPVRSLFALYAFCLSLPVKAQLLEVCTVSALPGTAKWPLSCTEPTDAGKKPSFTISWPVRPAREFHASSAVLGAVVIPTAADPAYTARFIGDRILVASVVEDIAGPCYRPTEQPDYSSRGRLPCKTRSKISLNDFDGLPVREFNRMMIQCLATGGRSAVPNTVPLNDPRNSSACSRLSFRDVLGDVE
jgi:hypothetical protein